jgi:hypothetical protein
MRKAVFAMGFCLWSFLLSAQHNSELYLNGASFFTSASAVLEVRGDVHAMSGTYTHNGSMRVQGNMYSSNSFQQRGSGTVRIENADVNTGERQFIQGSFAVRGGQSQIGVNDGSFYNLELANDQGIVYLVGSGNVADARNSVDFQPTGGVVNRIVTHDIGMTGTITWPANGSNYTSVFGLMNPAAGLTNLINNTVSSNGTVSNVDNGYIQGNFRRAIPAAGGSYGFPVGLEPAGVGAQRGLQYIIVTPGSGNSYDYIEGYFQSASANTPGNLMFIECFYEIDYFGAPDHGEWMFKSANPAGGTFSVTVYPQDDNFTTHTVWLVTQDDTVKGLLDECGGTPVGLTKSGLSSFGATSSSYTEFGLGGGSIQNLLPLDDIQLSIRVRPEDFLLGWYVESVDDYRYFELQRSMDGLHFETLYVIENTGKQHSYEDRDLKIGQRYYYRVRGYRLSGKEKESNLVEGLLPLGDYSLFAEAIYPNPAYEQFNVILHSSLATKVNIQIFSITGKEIRAATFKVFKGTTVVPVNASGMSSGTYLVRITASNYRETLKVIVQH